VIDILAYRHSHQWETGKFKTLFNRMTYQDQVAVMRYKRWQDREAHMISRLMWISALEKRSYPNPMHIDISEYGRPVWPLEMGDANISHSGDWVLLAITDNGSVGIDIEKKALLNIEDFQIGFTKSEWESITSVKGEKLDYFYKLWTQKEAVIKADGSGWSITPDSIEWKHDSAVIGDTVFSLLPIEVAPDHACHLAIGHGSNMDVNYIEIQNL
jgi:4'-phosphopantetheinyl transferase